MSLALSIADRLYEGTQKLEQAWNAYEATTSHLDGHTPECAYRVPFSPSDSCTCGYAKVERAIRELTTIVNTRDSAQGA